MSIERDYADFIGKAEAGADTIDAWHVNAFLATLYPGRPALAEGDAIPPSAHWLYFRPLTRLDRTGRDGHAAKGEFLPPIDLPRRMWAGGRLTVSAPLRLGEAAEKTSTIESIAEKHGRSGRFAVVTVRYDIAVGGEARLTEHHDIVYREDPEPDAPAPKPMDAPGGAERIVEIAPDPVMLFRYSALTFNSHRIHYDLDYVRNVEGYPGLMVHGPLIATWLIDLATEMRGEIPTHFDFRAVAPSFGHEKLRSCAREDGDGAELWAEGEAGDLRMKATARWGG